MLFSKSCNNAIRAVTYIAGREKNVFIQIREISNNLHISFHFLTKNLHPLVSAGYLKTARGARGGIAFAVAPGKITLMDIVLAVDGPALFEECLIGLPGCGIKNPCPLHDQWEEINESIKRMLNRTTVQALADQVADGNVRLADIIQA